VGGRLAAHFSRRGCGTRSPDRHLLSEQAAFADVAYLLLIKTTNETKNRPGVQIIGTMGVS